MIEEMFLQSTLDNFNEFMSVMKYFLEMPKYARICQIIPENVGGMDFTHFPNPTLRIFPTLLAKKTDSCRDRCKRGNNLSFEGAHKINMVLDMRKPVFNDCK